MGVAASLSWPLLDHVFNIATVKCIGTWFLHINRWQDARRLRCNLPFKNSILAQGQSSQINARQEVYQLERNRPCKPTNKISKPWKSVIRWWKITRRTPRTRRVFRSSTRRRSSFTYCWNVVEKFCSSIIEEIIYVDILRVEDFNKKVVSVVNEQLIVDAKQKRIVPGVVETQRQQTTATVVVCRWMRLRHHQRDVMDVTKHAIEVGEVQVRRFVEQDFSWNLETTASERRVWRRFAVDIFRHEEKTFDFSVNRWRRVAAVVFVVDFHYAPVLCLYVKKVPFPSVAVQPFARCVWVSATVLHGLVEQTSQVIQWEFCRRKTFKVQINVVREWWRLSTPQEVVYTLSTMSCDSFCDQDFAQCHTELRVVLISDDSADVQARCQLKC